MRIGRPLGLISPDYLGLGCEVSFVARPQLMSRANNVYVELVRTLGARGVIRIGGNTSDYANDSPNTPAVSSTRGTVVNDAALRDLGGFIEDWMEIDMGIGSGHRLRG